MDIFEEFEKAGHDLTHTSGPLAGLSTYYCENCGAFVQISKEDCLFHAPRGAASSKTFCSARRSPRATMLRDKLNAQKEALGKLDFDDRPLEPGVVRRYRTMRIIQTAVEPVPAFVVRGYADPEDWQGILDWLLDDEHLPYEFLFSFKQSTFRFRAPDERKLFCLGFEESEFITNAYFYGAEWEKARTEIRNNPAVTTGFNHLVTRAAS